jgi:hypothetical protein
MGMDDLETFYPAPRTLFVAGVEVPVRTLTFMDLGRFSKPLRPVIPLLQAADYRTVAEDHPEALCQAMSVATGIEPAKLGQMPLDDFLDIVAAVVEANLSFFLDRVVPRLRVIATLLNPRPPMASPDAGPTPSPASSEPDAALPTSAG